MNFYAYRLPGSKETVTGKSAYLRKGLCGSGFVVSCFGLNGAGLHTIPDGECFPLDRIEQICGHTAGGTMPKRSTTRQEHRDEVEAIKRAISEGRVSKAIAARCILVSRNGLGLDEIFRCLCERYPEAFVFCFHTDLAGTWIGASPELLLRSHHGMAESVSLAGTRAAGACGDWDKKNIHEHSIVTRFIADKFRIAGTEPSLSETATRVAGPVEHRFQLIKGPVSRPMDLAVSLSPTPALCGFPQKEAAELISTNESFPRGCYGGFCGPANDSGEMDLYVNLRSMQADNDNLCLYVGGGIVYGSDADEEWEETCRKAATLIQPLNLTI